jgi:hypothetical protein
MPRREESLEATGFARFALRVRVFCMDGMAWAACNHAPNPNPELFLTPGMGHVMRASSCFFFLLD